MTFDRISSYQVESYFAFVAKLIYLKLNDFVLLPRGIQIEGDNEINLVVQRKLSLYEVIHGRKSELTLVMKLSVCLRVARILNTLHSFKIAHGSVTSHNLVFDLDFSNDPAKPFRLMLCELELHDFKKYANMFSSYRCVSVWSSPECLK